ncbi:unnamed protein product, partial [Didymodactylos carnosus]
DRWEAREIDLSHDGNTLAVVTNENGLSKLYLIDIELEKRKLIENILPMGVLFKLNFHKENNNQLAFVLNTPQIPGDCFVLNLDDLSLIRWTESEIGNLNSDNFISPTLIHYDTFDNRKIPAFYYLPKSKDKKKYPVIINIHGGPEAQPRREAIFPQAATIFGKNVEAGFPEAL